MSPESNDGLPSSDCCISSVLPASRAQAHVCGDGRTPACHCSSAQPCLTSCLLGTRTSQPLCSDRQTTLVGRGQLTAQGWIGWQNLRAYCMCADPWKTNGSPRRLKKQRSTSKLTAQNDELTVSALTQWPYCYCVCLSWNKRWTINKAFLCFTAQKRNQNQNQRYHVLIYLTCNYSVYITHKASWYKGTTFLQYVSYQFQIPCLWADCHVKRWRGESWRETPVTESVSPFANGTTWYLWGVILQLYLWRRNQVCQNMFFS